ncbi:Voltage-gated ClC-type chloride channel ClcB [Chromobacterium violaceum]|uniref:Voltage-gated ClC-type chloride channel ClcB n=1 Tax=Chromobacterium violaceum TaxID=536 RepID=A0A447T5E1_CHRVL|nr:Voltage-gated ClC-type chloride channel ClcB [Chromobacterium violaceum]
MLGFQFALHAIEQGLSGRSGSLVAIARQLAPWQRALAPVLGGLLAGLILQQGRHLLRGAAEGDYLEAVRVGDGRLSLRRTLVNSLSSLATVASGGSIGREGAMVALAALGGSLLARLASLACRAAACWWPAASPPAGQPPTMRRWRPSPSSARWCGAVWIGARCRPCCWRR